MKLKKSYLLRVILFFFLEGITRLSFAAYYSNTNLQAVSQTMPPDNLTSWESTRSNFYMSLLGGGNLIPQINSEILFYSNYSAVDVENEFDLGFNGALEAGYRFHNFRTDLEVGYVSNSQDRFMIPPNSQESGFKSGYINGALGLVNVFYDFNNSEGFYPYLGVGYGTFLRNFSLVTEETPTDQHNYTASKTTWVVQGILGLGFKINRNFSFVLDYRHLFVPTVSVKYTNKAQTLSFSEHEAYSANLFNLGFTINF